MPINDDKTRRMLLLDDETNSLPASGFLDPTQFSQDATGKVTILGAAGSAIVWTAIQTPTALGAGQTDNYAPGSLAAVNRLRLSANAAGSQISGLVPTGVVDGQTLVITNISANDLTLLAENAASTAANRFALNGDTILGQNQSVTVLYDTGIQRWTQL